MPATFIDKDVSLNFVTAENNIKDEGIKYWYLADNNGNKLIKYTMGMSVLYAPFFFIAHALASPLGFSADGFSDIYEFLIEFSGLFYLLFGLLYLRKLLLQYYNEKITTITLLIVFFGTNLLYYSTVEAAMSHSYTFSLFSVFLYYVVQFYKNVSLKHTIILSICFGLIVLVRPLNILLAIPIAFYGILSFKDLKLRCRFIMQHCKYVFVFMMVVLVILLPQFLYYKHVTGSYFIFSYGKEGFFFNQFHLIDILFSFRKGWFIYTPLMLLAIYGIMYMKNHAVSAFKLSIILLLPLYLYLVSSWWCWWYGGSFSQRSLIDIYPLLALPLAAIIFRIQSFSKSNQRLVAIGLSFFIILNIFQTIQYKYNIIDFDGMTAKEYVQVFGTLDDQKIDTTLLDKPNYERAVMGLDK